MATKQLKIGSWNLCNGLMNKVNYVKDLLLESNIDILFLQETELKLPINVGVLTVSGYNIEVSKASSTSRLVAYIKNKIRYQRVDERIDSNVILLTVKCKWFLYVASLWII